MTLTFIPISDLKFELVNLENSQSPSTSEMVDKLWDDARLNNMDLHDEAVFRLVEVVDGYLRLERFRYKTFYVYRKFPKLFHTNQKPILAVSGVTFFGQKILVGKRSNSVSSYKGKWELVPSGAIQDVDQGIISLNELAINQLRTEFAEETSLDSGVLEKISLLGLIVDTTAYTADLIYRAEIRRSGFNGNLKLSELNSREYSMFRFIDLRWLKLMRILTPKFAPTSRLILRLILSKN